MARAKFVDKEIVFQEVPNEISLCYYITNCPHHCKGCHSQILWEDIGCDLGIFIQKDLDIYSQKGISCVLFMGGDNSENIEECLAICKKNNLKTALYSGCTKDTFNTKLLGLLDYVKIGPYIEELGGLDRPTTNQRFYRVDKDCLIDMTSTFYNRMSDE